MEEHFNKLTPAEAERLAKLIEELSEAQQAASQVLLHGYESCHPQHMEGPNNRRRLEMELSDVREATFRMVKELDLDAGNMHLFFQNKKDKKQRYFHHQ